MKHLITKFNEHKAGQKIKTRWSLNDAVITLYIHKFGFDRLGINDEELFINQYIGSTLDSFKMQCMNINHLLTDEGLPNASNAQRNAIEEYGEFSEEELRAIVDEILENTTEEQMKTNLGRVEDNIQWKEGKSERELKKAREDADKDINDRIERTRQFREDPVEIPYGVNDTIISDSFGTGVVKDIKGAIVTVDFEEHGIKRMTHNVLKLK